MRNYFLFGNSWKRRLLVDTPNNPGGGTGGGQPNPGTGATNTPPAVPPGGQGGAPSVDLGPFKSVEELAKGYKELQGMSTKSSQELKELREKFENLGRALSGNKGEGGDNYDPGSFLEEFANDPRGAIMNIIQAPLQNLTVSQLRDKIEKNLATMREKFPDFKDLEPEIEKMVDAGVFSAWDLTALARIYHGIKGEKAALEAAKSKTIVPGVENGMGTGAGANGAEDIQKLRAMPFEELEKLVKAQRPS